jgi:hypothetical protein
MHLTLMVNDFLSMVGHEIEGYDRRQRKGVGMVVVRMVRERGQEQATAPTIVV